MKMTGEKSPDFKYGKIVFCLKMSRLNYLVKEIPYSTYINIRKKCIKESLENKSAPVDLMIEDKDSEILKLKEKNTDLETRLAIAKVEYEENELVKEKLVAEITKNEDVIEKCLEK